MCNPRKECRCISVGGLMTQRPALGAVPSCETEKGCGPHDQGTASAGHLNATYENTAANGRRGSTFRDGTIGSSETLVVTAQPGTGGRRRPVLARFTSSGAPPRSSMRSCGRDWPLRSFALDDLIKNRPSCPSNGN